jgi:DNA modification methylase
MEIKSKQIELVDINKLVPYEKNMNKHTPEQIDKLIDLIKYQGFRDPLIVQLGTNIIAAGHGRWEAAKKMGMEKIPVTYQEFDNEAQFYAFVVSHNAIIANNWGGGLDLSQINVDIIDLGPELDISMLGLKDFVIEPAEKFEAQSDEDEVPEVVHPITRRGDIWLLGQHRLKCGDSTMIDDVEKLMNGEKADMVFTDPPYGVSYQSNMRKKAERFEIIKNDETFISEWVNVLPVVSSGWVFVWTSWKVIREWIEICEPIGDMTNMIIWDKGGGGIGDLTGSLSTDFEVALVYNRGSKLTGKRIGSVWSIGKDKSKEYVHPTQKPVALAETAFNSCIKANSTVLDLFLGSGSTLIACEKTNRKCYGMELDTKYVDVICQRWMNYTGRKDCILESTGQTFEELKNERMSKM